MYSVDFTLIKNVILWLVNLLFSGILIVITDITLKLSGISFLYWFYQLYYQ